MKIIFKMIFAIGCFFLTTTVNAQNRIIENDSYKSWISLGSIRQNISSIVSADGKYVAYEFGSPQLGNFVAIQDLQGVYKREFKDGSDEIITADGKRFIVKLPNDTLVILRLDVDEITRLSKIESFTIPKLGNGKWLGYSSTSQGNEAILRDLLTGEERKFKGVKDWYFNETGSWAFIKGDSTITYLDLTTFKTRDVFQGSILGGLTFSKTFDQVAFFTQKDNLKAIISYKVGENSANILVQDGAPNVEGYVISASNPIHFSGNNSRLLFGLRPQSFSDPVIDREQVQIFDYTNKTIVSDLANALPRVGLTASLDLLNKKITKINDSTSVYIGFYDNDSRNNYALTLSNNSWDEMYWRKDRNYIKLLSLMTGAQVEISSTEGNPPEFLTISPNEKFVIWFDTNEKTYFSYEISTGRLIKLTEKINASFNDDSADIKSRRKAFGVAGWLKNDSKVLIYDRYNIWKIDPKGKIAAVNLTLGNDKVCQVIFRRVEAEKEEFKTIAKDTLLLAGFDNVTKANGFWKLPLNGGKIQKCAMGPYVYHFSFPSPNIIIAPSQDLPQKAYNSNIYVVRRMSTGESPNLFITTDFIKYNPLTDIHPENEYRWLTSELLTWKLPNGQRAEGLLYKPINLDSSKKYPVIIHYYEKLSDGLNVFAGTEFSELSSGVNLSKGTISIPWYVSHGYIVFVPNIYYEAGNVTTSIVNSVKSAVNRLSKIRFIDTAKLGLQGHSFGGFQTITLIAHTNLFAAAQESAGYVNSISYYTQRIAGTDRSSYFDIDQGNLLSSPWESPGLYVANSPIFHVKKINTPLLILHNKGDDNVSYVQATDLFGALRREQKKVWMLNYPNENHMIYNEDHMLDFSMRQQQFFDYYLKGLPPPKWMTKGMSVNFDKTENSFQLDSSGKIP